FCLDEKARMAKCFRRGKNFAVHILAENQKHLARAFSAQAAARGKKFRMAQGLPLLPEAMAVLCCGVHRKIRGGDHWIIIGRVKKIAVDRGKPRPLLHTRRRYWNLGRTKR